MSDLRLTENILKRKKTESYKQKAFSPMNKTKNK